MTIAFNSVKKLFSIVLFTPFPIKDVTTKFPVLIAIMFAVPRLWAQPGQLKFDHIGIEAGLSESIVLAIAQDAKGYMWFGTADGLNRFDGYEFKVFKNVNSDSTSLSANYIPTVFVDAKKCLWVGTLGGLDLYDSVHERFIRYAPKLKSESTINEFGVNVILQSSDGTIWIGHNGAGLTKLVLEYSTFPPTIKASHLYREDKPNPQMLSDGNISGIVEDSSGALWISTWQGGLCRFDPATGVFVRFVNNKGRAQSICMNFLRALQFDRNGSLWIASEGRGLDRLDMSDVNLRQPEETRFHHFQNTPAQVGGISYNTVRTLLFERTGRLWIGTDGGGLNIYNRHTRSFSAYTHDKTNPASIASNRVVSLFEDNAGTLWCGLWGSGVSRYSPLKEKFINSPEMQVLNDQLSSKFLVAIFQDRKGNLWFGTHGAGANKYDPISQRVSYFKHDPDNAKSISHDVVWSITEDALGSIWMATDQGLNKLDTSTGTFTRFFHNPYDQNSLNTSFVTRVLGDDDMNVWVVTGEGLNCIDIRSNVVTRIGDPSLRASGAIASLAHDKNGMMWVGLGGLLRLDTKRKAFVGNPTAESVKLITSITVARDDGVWIGTYGFGFRKHVREDGTVLAFTERDGLPNNVVYGILEDDHGFLWMSTNKGIARFDPRTKQFTNYDVRDGLQSNEFNRGAFCKAADGMLLFGGINGFNAFYPDSVHDNSHVPPVVITLFKKFDEPATFDSSLSAMNEIVLRYDENFFSFEFAALDFIEPAENTYMYKLEGLEGEWVRAGTRRSARYTNVDPGDYLFRVKAANSDGVWNETGASVKVRIIPPFWKTSWFMFITAFTIAGAFGGFVRLISTRKLKKQLEGLERERVLQQERERISRDLHDHVGAQLVNIISGLDLVGKYAPPAETRAQRLLKSLQADARSSMLQLRETIWAIKTKAMTLEAFAAQVETYSRKQIEFNDDVQLHFESAYDRLLELSPIQVLNCFRIIQESLANCVKHAHAQNIWVSIATSRNEKLNITIKDDGMGARRRTTDAMSGNGVLNMQRRAEEVGGMFRIRPGDSSGIEVSIEIPLTKENRGT